MKTLNILIVDDEKEIADLVDVILKNEGYSTIKFYDAIEAKKEIESNDNIDLAILDVMMPGIDGFALCTKIREKYTYPIIMLTARIEDIDKITGLTIGADDYVTKPFNPLELLARVKAQLRRYKNKLQDRHQSKDESIRFQSDDTIEEDDENLDIVIERRKKFDMKPMSPEEAILQMELIEHGFYMFRNIDSDEISIVYKREDGGYGLIEHE